MTFITYVSLSSFVLLEVGEYKLFQPLQLQIPCQDAGLKIQIQIQNQDTIKIQVKNEIW